MANNEAVKVRREKIEACITCTLCNKLLRDATTISECLHTFCRRCIYKKISDKGLECCPTCNIDLGGVPLEKLREDHNLQDVRTKIFPFKRRKVEAPSVVIPVRRKERSISSLVVSTPKVSTQKITTTGRRTKPVPRKAAALRGSSFSTDEPKEEDPGEDCPESSSLFDILNKFNQKTRQKSSSADRIQLSPSNEAENGTEPLAEKSDLWQPLNCLVEVANRTKSLKSNSEILEAKLEPANVPDNHHQPRKAKLKEQKDKSEGENLNKSITTVSSEKVEPKKFRRICQKKTEGFRDSGISSQAVLDSIGAQQEKRIGPVWFSLVASKDWEGNASLPQIPAGYIRIKDGNIPVSFIQKYLMKKLDLTSEAEVEIKCMGQPVVPTLLLYDLVDLWIQTSSTSEQVHASIGSSAKEFVMVLVYARKVPDPE